MITVKICSAEVAAQELDKHIAKLKACMDCCIVLIADIIDTVD